MECGEFFVNVAKRNEHLRTTHLQCDECKMQFKSIKILMHHYSSKHNNLLKHVSQKGKVYKCEHCDKTFLHLGNKRSHVKRHHLMSQLAIRCQVCRQDFPSIKTLREHKRNNHNSITPFTEIRSAFRKNCIVLLMKLPYEGPNAPKSTDDFFNMYYKQVYNELEKQLNLRNAFKVWMVLYVDLFKTDSNNVISEYDTFFFRSGKSDNVITKIEDIVKFLMVSQHLLRTRFEAILTKGSNWSIHSITSCSLEIAITKPLNGSCITDKIVINSLQELKTINFIWEDNRRYRDGCLFYCVAAYFNNFTSDITVLDDFITRHLNTSNISLPVSLSQLSQFEKQNEHLDFKINILELQLEETKFNTKKVVPLRSYKYKACTHIINILWIRFYSEVVINQLLDREDQFHEFGHYNRDEEKLFFNEANIQLDQISEETDMNIELVDQISEPDTDISSIHADNFLKIYGKRGHFMLIQSLNKFLQYKNKRFVCHNCLCTFRSFPQFELHENICYTFKPILVEMPKKGEKISFKNFNKKFKLPFVIFYDFEAVLKPVDGLKCRTCYNSNNICSHKIKVMNKQIPSSYSLLLLDENSNIMDYSIYTGENCVEHFLNKLFKIRNKIFNLLQDKEPIIMTQQDKIYFANTQTCHICETVIKKDDKLGSKVADHSHLDSTFLGPAHNLCNLKRREQFRIPVICHNANKYDSHFILSALHMISNPEKITALPLNTESFRTFTVAGLNFLDSMAYLPMSLNQLTKDLKLTPNFKYKILDQLNLYESTDIVKKEMLLCKQIYPYEYVTDFNVYKEKSLPTKNHFSSLLTNTEINDDDYKHALNVFKSFNCSTFQDYTELYCLLDVALLGEVVMHFRNLIFIDIKLDLFQYISLPQAALDIMLKTTKNELELISDSTMHFLIEKNIRGGVVFCGDRYMENDLTDSKNDIIYVDVNSLYATSMTFKLPYSNYEWCSLEYLNSIDWENIDTNNTIGFILQVDLICPSSIHNLLSDYPVAPENVTITYDDLSPYTKHCLQQLRNGSNYKAEKLIASVGDKKNYLTHFDNLKFYLSLGFKLTKIHCGFQFIQANCFSSFINYCMENRKKSVSKFSGLTWKLLCNSLYGKTVERVRDRLNCKFSSNEQYCRKFISDSNAVSFKILNDNLVCIFQKQNQILMNKPICIGFSILERSKLIMYELYYKQLRPKFAIMKCLYTDTDSLILFCQKFMHDYNKDIFDIIKDVMDFSNFPTTHPLYSLEHKNKMGKIKSELSNNKLLRFVALRSKTYALEIDNKDIIRRAKGVSYNYQNEIPFQAYLDCLLHIQEYTLDQYQIRSYDHNIVTQKLSKICFSSLEDKRFLFNCGVHSLPYHHFKLNSHYDTCPICHKSVF